MTKKYVIAIEETAVQNFEVEANSQEEALRKVETGYKNGNYVLEFGEVQAKKMSVLNSDNEFDKWIEF